MADRQLRFVLSAQDKGASSTLTGVASKAEGVGHRISGAFSKVGGIIGGEVGDALQGVADGFDKLSEHGMTMSQKLTAGGAALAGVGAGLTAMGDKENAASQQLDQAITNTGHSADAFSKQIEETVSHMEAYGISAVTTKNALQTLTTATGDPTKALGLMGEAADLAAARHTDLTTAAGQLAKVVGGSGTKTLKAFGVEVVKNADGTKNWTATNDILAGKLKGQASAAADTLSGRFKALRTEVTDNVAAFGAKYGPAITGVGVAMMTLTPVVSGAANGIKALAARFGESAVAATASAAETTAANVGVAASSVETAAVVDGAAVAQQGALFELGGAAVVSSGVVVGAADAQAAGVVAAGEVARAGWMASLGPIALVVGAVGAIVAAYEIFSGKAKDAGTVTDQLTQAITADGDAFGASTRQIVAHNLESGKAYDAALKLGISQKQLTDAAMGNKPALEAVNTTLKANFHGSAEAKMGVLTVAAALGQQTLDLAANKKASENLAAQNKDTGGGLDTLAGKFGTQTASLAAALAAQIRTKDSAAAATLQMQVESDAAGLLSAAFDKLNGVTIDVETANIAFKNTVSGLNQTMKDNGHQLGDNTVKGRANTQAILDSIKAAQAHGDAVGKQTKSVKDGTTAFDNDVQALKRHLIALGYNKDEVQRLIDKYAKIPATKLTFIDINAMSAKTKLSDVQRQISLLKQNKLPGVNVDTTAGKKKMTELLALAERLTARDWNVYVTTVFGKQGTATLPGLGTSYHFATGGLVSGQGTSTSDSISASLSKGEYVVNAAATTRNRAALDAMNNGGAGGGSSTVLNITINTPQIWSGNSPELGRVVASVLERHVGRGGTVTIGRGVR